MSEKTGIDISTIPQERMERLYAAILNMVLEMRDSGDPEFLAARARLEEEKKK